MEIVFSLWAMNIRDAVLLKRIEIELFNPDFFRIS